MVLIDNCLWDSTQRNSHVFVDLYMCFKIKILDVNCSISCPRSWDDGVEVAFHCMDIGHWCDKVAIVLDVVSPYYPLDSLHFLLVISLHGVNAEVSDLLVWGFELVVNEEDYVCVGWHVGFTYLWQPSNFPNIFLIHSCPSLLLSRAASSDGRYVSLLMTASSKWGYDFGVGLDGRTEGDCTFMALARYYRRRRWPGLIVDCSYVAGCTYGWTTLGTYAAIDGVPVETGGMDRPSITR